MSDRAAYWQRLLADWERSGLSQAEFCRRRRLKAATFAWWKRRLIGPSAGRRKRRLGGTKEARGKRRGRDSTVGRHSATVTRDSGRVGFVELALPGQRISSGSPRVMPTNSSAGIYEIVLPGGTLLRLPSDFEAERVTQLVQAVAATDIREHLAGVGGHRAGSGEHLAGLGGHMAGSGGCSAC